MKSKIKLVLAVHNHQPVGNFDHVFQDCFDKCYKPFLKVLKRHPSIKITLHFTGSLMEWIEKNEPTYFDTIRELIASEQIELMGGGFYEPLLAMIPKRDAVGQISLQSDYLKKHFSVEPKGAWLAERVWDANIPEILCDAKINYTIIDDTHFKYAGFNQENIHGYYVSERIGSKVNVFPIDKNLRYMIPFVQPQNIIDYLGVCAESFPGSSVCYADDGEKFGVWPETFKTCYEERWLDYFFSALKDNSDWIEVKTAGEVVSLQKSNGLVYLPDASYEEMLEWALPLNAAFRYKIMKKNLESQDLYGQFKDFIRGGIWPNFLVKYPESNLMYRKMLGVSRKLSEANLSKDKYKRAVDELYRGQCNCSYWHGLFGGLYLNYLREAIYKHLIIAENIIQSGKRSEKNLKIKKIDYTSNGLDEIVVSNKDQFSLFAPEWGGALVEHDFRPKAFNLSNVMTRRKEVYHIDLIRHREEINSGYKDIEYNSELSEKDRALESVICYDKYSRYSFLDHFFIPDVKLESLLSSCNKELGDFHNKPFVIEEIFETGFVLHRAGHFGDDKQAVSITKKFTFDKHKSTINAFYSIQNNSDKPVVSKFGIEFNYSLLAGRDDGRFYEINDEPLEDEEKFLISKGESVDVETFSLVDLWQGLKLKLTLSEKASLIRFPIETVSQSGSGLEKNYQASTLIPTWNISIDPGKKWEISLKQLVTEEV